MKLLQGFDMEVLLYDPYMDAREIAAMGTVKMKQEELVRLAVSIQAPSIPETYHMFCSKTFALIEEVAILINTASGSLLDEEELRMYGCDRSGITREEQSTARPAQCHILATFGKPYKQGS